MKWGILGTSFISEVMAEAIQASSTGELIAIGSRSVEKGKQFSRKFSVPKHYQDYYDLLNDAEIDAVYLGLPNHLHKEWMIHCAKAKKHILCEKPFVLNIAEAKEVISYVEKQNIFCMEALMYRHHPLITKLQELTQSKIIGEIKLYQAVYTANISHLANPVASSAILNLGCYPVSLVRLLANAEPIEIMGSGRMSPKTGLDHQASVILKFANDSMAIISTADDLEMFWQFDLYGTEGHLQVVTNPWLPTMDNNKIIIHRHNEPQREINITAEKPLYTYQIDAMSAHQGISLSDSLENTRVLESWMQQIAQKNLTR